MRRLLKFIFKVMASRVINRYRPITIGITGSVGKSMAKEAVFAVLGRRFWAWKNSENFNNEFGVPMTILGIKPPPSRDQKVGERSVFWKSKWAIFKQLPSAFWLAFGFPRRKYPQVLVLEMAADRPGDIEYLTGMARPQIGVVTAVGEIPVHVEFYASPQEVAREKSKLVEKLPAGQASLAVLNYDDQTVLDMEKTTKAKVVTFGFAQLGKKKNEGPTIQASDFSYFPGETFLEKNRSTGVALTEKTGAGGLVIGGLTFKVQNQESFVPVRVNNLIGIHQVYGILAAVAVGLHLEMNLVEIAQALENIDLPKGRMTVSQGIKNSIIIDDTYNASPLSTHAALDTLSNFSRALSEFDNIPRRRMAILGEMKELGKYTEDSHRMIGNLAGERTDFLITVGTAAKFIADSAFNQMSAENILSFSTSQEAAVGVKELIEEKDVVLVKGSRSVEMEKIVKEIKAAIV